MKSLREQIKRIPVIRSWIKLLYDARNERLQEAKVRDFLSGVLPFTDRMPVKLAIGHEPTIRCNLRCKMCYQGPTRAQRHEELGEDEVAAMNGRLSGRVRRVKLVGGEPLVRPDIFRILEFWDSRGVPISLQSNCTLINEGNVSELARFKYLRDILTSLDGPPEVHDRVRGVPGSFERLGRAIKLVRERLPWARFTVFATLLAHDNADKLKELVDTAKSLGLGTINVLFEQVYTPTEIEAAQYVAKNRLGWADGSYGFNTQVREQILPPRMTPEALRRKLHEARAYGLKTGCFVNFSPFNYYAHIEEYAGTRPGRAFCTKLMAPELRIDQQGRVVWCDIIGKSFGSLVSQPPEEIWTSRGFQDFRQYLFSGSLPICRRCCKAVYI